MLEIIHISPLAIKEPGHFCDDIYAEGFSASYQKMLRWDEAQYFKADALDQRHMAFVRGRENYDRLVSEARRPVHFRRFHSIPSFTKRSRKYC